MGSHIWDADVTLDLGRCRELIVDAFPQLAQAQFALLGQGWDNVVVSVDDTWAFRLPRRAIGASIEPATMAVLAEIAHALPLPVPVPLFEASPRLGYPYPFFGLRLLRGQTACGRELSPDLALELAVDLAEFLRCLHALEPNATLPADRLRRSDVAHRLPGLLDTLDRLTRQGHLDAAQSDTLRELGLALHAHDQPERRRACLVHGDLYPRHVLLDDQDRACGIIDWGDAHRGDVACDLRALWLAFDAPTRDRALEAYGPLDHVIWQRARFLALHFSAMILDYGIVEQDEAMITMAYAGLEHVRDQE